MDFDLTDEQRAFLETARAFARGEWLPRAPDWDERQEFPVEALRGAAALGFARIYVGEEFGGSGLGRVDAAIIFEELAAACASTAAYLSIHNKGVINSSMPAAAGAACCFDRGCGSRKRA